jgi:hypothetical protein
MGLIRFWFFARGGAVLIAAADCSGPEAAVRLARDYNRQPGPAGPVDLITDNKAPGNARQRIAIEAASDVLPAPSHDEND